MISDMYAPTLSITLTRAAVMGAVPAFTWIAVPISANGFPKVRFGYSAATLNQNISCTRTGVPRKIVM